MKEQYNSRSRTAYTRKRMVLDVIYIFGFFVGLAIALCMVITVLISAILLREYSLFDLVLSIGCAFGIGVLVWIGKGFYIALVRLWRSFASNKG